ncbi:MAG: YfcE family phosphodiesterase [Clostridia bacterium]|nr:YfcE family phosphodiesterase [Clostridia bacterium]
MDILILSDTHGHAERITEVLRRTGADTLLFLGDGLRDLAAVDEQTVTVRAVRGNCDWFSGDTVPELRLEIFGGYRVLMMHGHRYGVKGGIGAAVAAAAREQADVLLYGHTHEPFEATLPVGTPLADGTALQKSLLVVSPGSLGAPARGAPSFATLTVRQNGILAGFGKL